MYSQFKKSKFQFIFQAKPVAINKCKICKPEWRGRARDVDE